MKTYLLSNSSIKLFRTCPRLFWHSQLQGGRGISSMYVDEDLIYGTWIHEVMPWLWQHGQDDGPTADLLRSTRAALETALLDDPLWNKNLLEPERTAKAREWGRLLEGHLWGMVRLVLPRLRKGYVLKDAEGDAVKWLVQTDTYRIGLIAKPDTIVEGVGLETPSGLGYIEYKTTGDKTQKWFRQWVGNPQAWTGGITLRGLGREIEWFLVVGLYKGQDRDGYRSSPFCWGWSDGNLWMSVGTTRKGWGRASTDNYPGGVRAWVYAMDEDQLAAQFLETLPVIIDWELAEEWERNLEPILGKIAAVAMLRDARGTVFMQGELIKPGEEERLFYRELSKCEVGEYGDPCTMQKACHNAAVRKDPVGSGKYRPRTAHHPLEKRYWELEEVR